MDCLFCKIINKDIPSTIIYEDDHAIAFDDINPVAPTHKLIIPKQHIATLDDLNEENQSVIGHLFVIAKQIAEKNELKSYRTIINCNEGAGQTVFHLHVHLLGGRDFIWPPG